RGRRLLRLRGLHLRRVFITRWSDDYILALLGNPLIVGLVGVVIRHTAKPYGLVVERESRHKHTDRGADHDESRSALCVPDAARVIVAASDDEPLPRDIVEVVAPGGIVPVHPEAAIVMIEARPRAFESPASLESLMRRSAGRLSTGRTHGQRQCDSGCSNPRAGIHVRARP